MARKTSFENNDIDTPRQLNDNASWGPVTYKKTLHPLMLMVSLLFYSLQIQQCIIGQVTHQRTRLLTHPVVGSLLHYKWMTFGAPSFFVNLIFYVVFLAFFVSLVVFAPLPNGPICRGTYVHLFN